MQTNPSLTSQARIVGSPLLSIGALSHDLSNFDRRGAGNIDGLWMGDARDAAGSAWSLVLVCGLLMFFLRLYLEYRSVTKPGPYPTVLQSNWNLHVWSRKEALFLSSVSQYHRRSIVFTSDVEHFSLLSSVARIGTLMVSVVSGRTRLPSCLLRLPQQPMRRVAACLS